MLVQVPRRGYLPVAVLPGLPAPGPVHARAPARSGCPGRGAAGLPLVRAGRDGVHLPGVRRPPAALLRRRRPRTAEELGRAFPGVPVERSGAGTVLATVAAGRALVVSTPGAEPVAPDGYAAALLLDAWALLERPSLTRG